MWIDECEATTRQIAARVRPGDLGRLVRPEFLPRRLANHINIQLPIEEPATCLAQRVQQNFLVGKMSKQRRQVGKSFMKRRNVDVGRLHEIFAYSVDNGMRRFVGNDVVRQAGEDGLSRQIAPRLGAAGLEIAEQNAVCGGTVESIGLAHRVRKKIETFGGRGPCLLCRIVIGLERAGLDLEPPRTAARFRSLPRRPSADGSADQFHSERGLH